MTPLYEQALAPGDRLGPYRIDGTLGRGGMGEVYRARDTTLDRDVAIKMLPREFVGDRDRLRRFESEARALAALNHPGIGAIYGVEEREGRRGLVLELVDGPTLADRIARGPLPWRETQGIARQIAEALEATHARGIIHRDLKPSNIKVRPDGTVKVLDFGLARDTSGSSVDVAASTLTGLRTEAGMILGTPGYMSPEQARGAVAGPQADIWAFGVILYELLTGAAPFQRASVADTIAAVLEAEPDFSRLPTNTPEPVRRLLRRCLEKDLRRRLQHIGDIRIELEDTAMASTPAAPFPAKARTRFAWRLAAGGAAIAAVGGAAGWWMAHRAAPRAADAVIRFAIRMEGPLTAGPFGVRRLAISPDGTRIAYSAGQRLWIHHLDRDEATAIDVRAVSDPVFSPTGEWIAFVGGVAPNGLYKVPTSGGTPQLLAATTERSAGTLWRADGTIVFATNAGIYAVSDQGGSVQVLKTPRADGPDRVYAWPQLLPDRNALLVTVLPRDTTQTRHLGIVTLNTADDATVVVKGGSGGYYVPTGQLVYAAGAELRAIQFDVTTNTTRGEPLTLSRIRVASAADNGAADFALSEQGTLVFAQPGAPGDLRALTWIDRRGREERLPLEPGRLRNPRISPDGTRVAIDVTGSSRDIWVWNLERGALTRVTTAASEDVLPVWSVDSRRIFFGSDRSGQFDVYSQAADGASEAQVEFSGPGAQMPAFATPDGRQLLVHENFTNLSLLTFGRTDRIEPLLRSEFGEWLGTVSPDGRWLAYESNELGERPEVFIRPFPDVSARREKVSIDGGRYPRWSPNGGNELFYLNMDGAMMSVAITLSPTLALGNTTRLFQTNQIMTRGPSGMLYDVSPIDGRFIHAKPLAASAMEGIELPVIVNFHRELEAQMASRAR